jgi:NAD(P)-dependent dehydrogenase (short-subunit alcohol dehydrogenase family)
LPPYPSLKDRTAFISGGGSGIGASIVEHSAAQGSKVAFVDVDEPASKALAARRVPCSSSATSAT